LLLPLLTAFASYRLDCCCCYCYSQFLPATALTVVVATATPSFFANLLPPCQRLFCYYYSTAGLPLLLSSLPTSPSTLAGPELDPVNPPYSACIPFRPCTTCRLPAAAVLLHCLLFLLLLPAPAVLPAVLSAAARRCLPLLFCLLFCLLLPAAACRCCFVCCSVCCCLLLSAAVLCSSALFASDPMPYLICLPTASSCLHYRTTTCCSLTVFTVSRCHHAALPPYCCSLPLPLLPPLFCFISTAAVLLPLLPAASLPLITPPLFCCLCYLLLLCL
jgi:hypothetical protein